MPGMRRREFVSLLGGAAAAWPLAARAQQTERMRRVGVLMPWPRTSPEAQADLAAFVQGLQQLGWTEGRNLQIDIRWGCRQCRQHSQRCDGIGRARARTSSWPTGGRRGAVAAGDPRRADRVRDGPRSGRRRLCREPGAAGRQRDRLYPVRIQFEREMAGAAQGGRAGRDASGSPSGSRHAAGIGQFGVIQSVAPSLGVEVSPVDVRDTGEIERAVAAFARSPNGGLIVTASPLATFIAS